jgi:hypothetical protein
LQKIQASKRTSQKPIEDINAREKVGELLNGANKILEELLKKQSTDESLPYELPRKGACETKGNKLTSIKDNHLNQ